MFTNEQAKARAFEAATTAANAGLASYEQAHPFAVVIPGKSSASILMVAEHEGRKKVLLAKRVRHDWWGNFGGKADDTDKTLLNAAAREANKESMGIYHALADDLIKAPSHDLIKGGSNPDALHRMYLLKTDYKDPTIFMEELGKQTATHSQEYTDFAWVDVDALLGLVQANLDAPNDPAKEQQYSLTVGGQMIYIHHPLMDMLRQAPVVAWLQSLQSKQPIIRKIHTQGSIGCAISASADILLTPLDKKAARKAAVEVKKLEKQIKEVREFGVVGAALDTAHERAVEASTKARGFFQYPPPPFFDPRAEALERLYHLTSNDMMRFRTLGNEQIRIHAAARASRIHSAEEIVIGHLPEQTATDAYLKWSLEKKGQTYTEGHDQQNIYNFLKDVSSDISSSYAEELNPTDVASTVPEVVGYKRVLLDAMAEERKMKD